jgi:hypothetical protein
MSLQGSDRLPQQRRFGLADKIDGDAVASTLKKRVEPGIHDPEGIADVGDPAGLDERALDTLGPQLAETLMGLVEPTVRLMQ